MIIRLAIAFVLTGALHAATVHQGQLSLLDGPGDLMAESVITAGSVYDGGAGSSSDGVRLVNGIDFGDSYTPVNPSFSGSVNGVTAAGGGTAPDLGDTELNEVLRIQGYGDVIEIDFPLPTGVYTVQLLFWEGYFGHLGGGGIGSRVMDMSIEGEVAFTGLDMIEEHGLSNLNQAILYTHTFEVSDGNLDIEITSPVENATLAGIIISSHSSGSAPPGPPDVVGADEFQVPDGTLNTITSGAWFDFDNSTTNGPDSGHEGVSAPWQNSDNNPIVSNGQLITNNSSIRRAFNGLSESRGSFSADPSSIHRQLYLKFEMTRSSDTTWSGASAYDFGTERILFGVPFAPNPSGSQREFAIHVLNSGAADGHAYSGIQPIAGQTVMLVGKIDYENQLLSLFLEPDLSQPESSSSAIASRDYTAPDATTAIRFGSASSGGNGDTAWDDLVVATTWEGLSGSSVIANDDSITLNPLEQARVQVLTNDFGDLDPATLTITSLPSAGTATPTSDGSILYESTGSSAAADAFSYSISSPGGTTDEATVSVSITHDVRFDSDFVNFPDTAPIATGYTLENAFPGITFSSPHDFATSGNSLFIVEGDGRIQLIPDVTSPTKTEFLDITDRVENDGNERACKGIALHPDYANNGYLYVTYNHGTGASEYVRLSRFTRSAGNPLTADPASEVILIDQYNEGDFHNISVCRFGPDGYLYIGLGDEGTQNDGFDNSQHIDKDLWSSLLRIDVDMKDGNLQPNPDTDIPGSDTGSANFLIPDDNPFVGASSFNGQTLVASEIRTEIFVTGLRNPWQFSFDPLNGELWLADVGRGAVEEINVFSSGDNGGWAWREGDVAGIRSGEVINGATQAQATLSDPLYTYGRGGGAFEGNCVIGGIVYRGNSIPALTGKYLFCDYGSGNIWSLERGPTDTVERLATDENIVSFAADPSNDDVLLLDRAAGMIHRLVEVIDDSSFPELLSETNFFADLSTLTPNPGAHFYDVNLRFWSDEADKSRWFLIQNTADTINYSRDDPWTFPEGMVWAKHFDLELTPGDPATKRRIETRFLVRSGSGIYGLTYRWNHITDGMPQTDATLVPTNGEDLVLPNQVWHYPSRGECTTCHNPSGGYGLSFNTRQLNLEGLLAGLTGNQLDTLHTTGYLDQLPEPAAELPRHVRPDETTYSLEARARSYLDVNCSYCHRPDGAAGGSWDGRHFRTLAQTKLVNGPTNDAPLNPGDLLVVPGNANASIIHNRASATNGYGRMPPLATNLIDEEGVQLLADWINGEVSDITTYDQWRELHFGNLTSLHGDPAANPDGDNLSNEQEYHFLTDPNNAASTWQTTFTLTAGDVTIPLPALPNRKVLIEHSTDLELWQRWDAPGNHGIPFNPATSPSITAPSPDPAAFFRLEVTEN